MQNQKDKFQLQEGVSYINCAYMSPLLKSSEEIGVLGMQRKRNPFEIKQEDFFTDIIPVKNNFAEMINCKAENVFLCPAVSYGFSSILNSFKAPNKNHCLLVENEFPSGYFAAEKWARNNKAELKILKSDNSANRIENWNENLLSEINEQTAFVLISSVHWMDGSIFDLKRIGEKCRLFGAKLLVDGTQSVGAMPMDVEECKIDLLVCACYKWLLGPYSIAIAYVNESLQTCEALEESWINRKNAEDFSKLANYEKEYFPFAAKFNMGQTNDFIKSPMLANSLSQILEWKVEEIQAYCKNLLHPFLDLMEEIGVFTEKETFQANHLIGFRFGNKLDANKLQMECAKQQIFLSSRGESLRISPNVYNTNDDIQKLIQAVKNAV